MPVAHWHKGELVAAERAARSGEQNNKSRRMKFHEVGMNSQK
jgi:hypothetical protein